MGEYRQTRESGPSWTTIFTATLAAVVVGGLFLGVCVRAYIHWSVQDTWQQMEKKR